MIIDDQDTHWHWSRLPIAAPRCTNCRHRIAAAAVDSRATRALLLYASIRSSPFLSVNARPIGNGDDFYPRPTRFRSWTNDMWQKISLRPRVNLLLAIVFPLAVAIHAGRLVLEAGPRVQAEDQSVIRLAREFIDTIVAGLNEAPDPEARLNQIVNDLNRLRHVSITRQGAAVDGSASTDRSDDTDNTRSPPAWFVALVHPEKTTVNVPFSIKGNPGSLLITYHPNDEMAEIWDGIVTQLLVGSGVAIVLFLITSMVVSRALAPIEALSQAITKIEAGSYDTSVKVEGPPELTVICEKLNHLASALGAAIDDKRRLAERVVSLQDVERNEIARELHDEFGPYLFSLRAHASALTRAADLSEPNLGA